MKLSLNEVVSLTDRFEIISELKNYFQVYELVGRKTYNKYKDDSWQFLQKNALHCLLIVRVGLELEYGKEAAKCTINDWFFGGKAQQRGLRTNVQQLYRQFFYKNILYLSGHPLGCAFDLLFAGISAPHVRRWIIKNKDLFPCKIRLEYLKNGKEITWTHFDTKQLERLPKVYLFNV